MFSAFPHIYAHKGSGAIESRLHCPFLVGLAMKIGSKLKKLFKKQIWGIWGERGGFGELGYFLNKFLVLELIPLVL